MKTGIRYMDEKGSSSRHPGKAWVCGTVYYVYLRNRSWRTKIRVKYGFFEKSMAANTGLHDTTSLSEQTKFSSLRQEFLRRLLHTNRRLSHSSRMDFLERFSQKNSSHRPNFMKKFLIAGITSYSAKLRNSLLPDGHPGLKPLYLGTHYDIVRRWKRKALARYNWYKDGNTEAGQYNRWK